MRYYIINYKGEILGEASNREEAEAKMRAMFTLEEIAADEIEVIEG